MDDKIVAFEYVIACLLNWKSETYGKSVSEVQISKTQALKLLFLTAAIPSKGDKDLLDIFNRFFAMQFGPVESDILNSIMEKNFHSLIINDSFLYIESFPSINKELKERIDYAICSLQKENPTIVKYTATQLVELTHRWWCWKKAYQFAQMLDKGSFLMNSESIRNSNKVFVL